jgi:hypothetical protein
MVAQELHMPSLKVAAPVDEIGKLDRLTGKPEFTPFQVRRALFGTPADVIADAVAKFLDPYREFQAHESKPLASTASRMTLHQERRALCSTSRT